MILGRAVSFILARPRFLIVIPAQAGIQFP
ncbi:hypothetical protein SAMN04487785_104317 [Dyella jiangningensis]|nr:hypothetical protein BDW41_10166 [Dyella sp. AtDHG13]SDJ93890.1 hypothetical protein SAMN04487785_104317 [Dyella jiangningensis]